MYHSIPPGQRDKKITQQEEYICIEMYLQYGQSDEYKKVQHKRSITLFRIVEL